MTEFRVSRRNDLVVGETRSGRSDALMDMAIAMDTAATSTRAETAGKTTFEPIEINENGKRRWRSEAPGAPSD